MTATAVPITGANTIVGYSVTVPFAEADVYTFSFPYLDKDNFEIVVNTETTLVRTTDYTFTSDYLIQLTASGVARLNVLYGAFTTPVTVIIRRRTLLTVRLVDYQDGATLTEADLDLAANQAFYLIQEVYDSQEIGSIAINPVDGNIDFDAAEIINIAEPTSNTSAATLNYVLENVITPTYAENDEYRTGRLIFNSAGDLLRANKDTLAAPAVLVGADFDTVLTVAQLAQIATNKQDLIDHENATVVHGVSGNVVGDTDVQTLTNKTLTSPVVNTPTGIVKGDVGLSNVDNTSDATKDAAATTLTNKTLASPAITTPTGIVKGDVGLGNVDNTSDATKNAAATTLTNKTLTSPVVNTPSIVTPSRLDSKQDTYANLVTYASSASNGQFCFATDQKLMYQVVDTVLTAVGGGGSGSLDTFLAEDFQSTVYTDFTTGQDADADAAGTGTVGGVLSDDAATNISGSNSLKFVHHATDASSDNDFFICDADLAIDTKQVDNDMGVNFYYKYDGANGDMKFIALDQDDVVLTSDLDLLDAATKATRFSTSFYIPSGTTGIRYGFQVVTGNSSSIFIVDDIELSMNPFVYKNLINTNSISLETNDGRAITANTEDIHFSGSGTGWTSTGDTHFYTVQYANSVVDINFGMYQSGAATNSIDLAVNGTRTRRLSTENNERLKNGSYVSKAGEFPIGTQLSLRSSTGITLSAGSIDNFLTFVETAETAHVITPAKSNMTDWEPYVPTGGWTSNVSYSGEWRIVGDTMEIEAVVSTSGTPNATALTISMPSGYTIDETKLSTGAFGSGSIIGSGFIIDNSPASGRVFAMPYANSATSIAALASGSGGISSTSPFTFVSGDSVKISVRVPIVESSSDANFLAAVPVQKVAYVKYLGAGTTQTMTVAPQTLTMNNLSGDTDFLSLDSNEITLSAGKYIIRAHLMFYSVSSSGRIHTYMYNVTDSVEIGSRAPYFYNNGVGGHNTHAYTTSSNPLTVTKTTVIDIRGFLNTISGTVYFGDGLSAPDDVNGVVEITKLR